MANRPASSTATRRARAMPQARPIVSAPPARRAGQPVWSGPPGSSFARRALRARFVIAFPLLVIALGVALGISLTVPGGVVLALAGMLVALLNRQYGSPTQLLAALGGRPVDPRDQAGLANLVEGLCIANGLSLPQLRLLDDEAPNALLLGRGDQAVLICTTGLLALLDRIELEGIVAHELAQQKRGDLRLSAIATGGLGLYARLSPRAAITLKRLVGADRQALADQTAVAMTRYPPGLISALSKLGQAPSNRPRLSPVVLRLTAALWCVNLAEAKGKSPLVGELDLGDRVAALAEL